MDDSVYCDIILYVSAARVVADVVVFFFVCDLPSSESRTVTTTRPIDTDLAP
jgi:hypothetical protein